MWLVWRLLICTIWKQRNLSDLNTMFNYIVICVINVPFIRLEVSRKNFCRPKQLYHSMGLALHTTQRPGEKPRPWDFTGEMCICVICMVKMPIQHATRPTHNHVWYWASAHVDHALARFTLKVTITRPSLLVSLPIPTLWYSLTRLSKIQAYHHSNSDWHLNIDSLFFSHFHRRSREERNSAPLL